MELIILRFEIGTVLEQQTNCFQPPEEGRPMQGRAHIRHPINPCALFEQIRGNLQLLVACRAAERVVDQTLMPREQRTFREVISEMPDFATVSSGRSHSGPGADDFTNTIDSSQTTN